jgi:hypothetical protein
MSGKTGWLAEGKPFRNPKRSPLEIPATNGLTEPYGHLSMWGRDLAWFLLFPCFEGFVAVGNAA